MPRHQQDSEAQSQKKARQPSRATSLLSSPEQQTDRVAPLLCPSLDPTVSPGSPDQTAWLANAQVQHEQRVQLAGQIGRVQGNQGLQQALALAKPSGVASQEVKTRWLYPNGMKTDATVQRQGGRVTVGAAAEAVTESHGEFGQRLLELLEREPGISIQAALHRIVEAEIASAPTIAETRDLLGPVATPMGNRYGAIIANSNYTPHDNDLPRTLEDATRMESQLAGRGYQTQVHYDLGRDEMLAAWLDPLLAARMGDEVVLFYSGHGVAEGLKDVNGTIFGLDRFGALREIALREWVDLTIILESCHSGSIADYVRRQEIVSLRDQLQAIPGSEAAGELVDIASDVQRIKDEITVLEGRKQACLNITDEEMQRDPSIVERAVQRAEAMNPQIQQRWQVALVLLTDYQARIHELTGFTVSLPVFEEGHWQDFWTNQAQLDVLSSMINQVLSLARGSGG